MFTLIVVRWFIRLIDIEVNRKSAIEALFLLAFTHCWWQFMGSRDQLTLNKDPTLSLDEKPVLTANKRKRITQLCQVFENCGLCASHTHIANSLCGNFKNIAFTSRKTGTEAQLRSLSDWHKSVNNPRPLSFTSFFTVVALPSKLSSASRLLVRLPQTLQSLE